LLRRAEVDEEIENETLIELGDPALPRDHLRLPIIADCLPCLERLRITYGVRRCGLNFNWNVFHFTLRVNRFIVPPPKGAFWNSAIRPSVCLSVP